MDQANFNDNHNCLIDLMHEFCLQNLDNFTKAHLCNKPELSDGGFIYKVPPYRKIKLYDQKTAQVSFLNVYLK